jgi:hypothetical protein
MAPTNLAGLNISLDLRTKLGICHLKFLRQAIFSNSEAGNLLLMSIKYTQIEAGISANILERPDIPLPYITSTWIHVPPTVHVPTQYHGNHLGHTAHL